MRGRTLFKRAKTILNFMVSLTKILPPSLLYFFLTVFKNWHGKLGIGLRYILVSALSKKCGDNVAIHTNVVLKNLSEVSFGDNISIHSFCYIDGAGGLIIKNNVSVAHSSSILTTNHTWFDKTKPIKYNPTVSEPVLIKEDVWIGCGVRILAGVTIQKRVVVAAGAVVAKSVETNTVVGGVPAKTIKYLN
jgi:acetyltransferase-like isoleucine patch superfamily enzyme